MKKISNLLFILIITTMVLFPRDTFAVWWNPFTWSVFQKSERIQDKQEVSLPPSTIISTSTSDKVIVEPVKTVIVKPKMAVVTTSPAESLSIQDQNDIASTMRTFITAVHIKDAEKVNSLISSQSKAYFEKILTLSKTAKKTELLSQDFSTVVTVILVRFYAASTTLEIQGEDIIKHAVTFGSSYWLDTVDFNNFIVATKVLRPNIIDVIITSEGKQISASHVTRENGTWKIDYASIFDEKNKNVEKELQIMAQKNRKSREETMELILKNFLGESTDLNYLVWVPLNERGDLSANNVTFQGLSDTVKGYSIKFPDYWETDFVDSTTFLLAPYSADGIRPTIAITPNLAPYSQNLDEYIEYFLRELPKNKADISGEISHTKIIFKNEPAYKVTYKRLRTFNEGRTYITQVIDSLIIIRNGIVYLIEYRNGLAEFEQGKALANKILDTLKFGPICTSNCRTDMYDNN